MTSDSTVGSCSRKLSASASGSTSVRKTGPFIQKRSSACQSSNENAAHWLTRVFSTPPQFNPQRSIRSSKIEAQPELDRPRVVALGRNHAEGLRTLQVHRRIGEIHVIEQVEKLSGEGKRSLLGDCSLL